MSDATVAVLATVGIDGRPHLVPVTYAYDDDAIYTAVDHKPKRSRDLKRLVNVRRDPRVTLLVQHYDDDWSALWWCRLEGTARIAADGPAFDRTVELLVEKYEQYAQRRPDGPAIVVEVAASSGWRA